MEPKKPINDPKVAGILLAAGAVWLGTMAYTLANPDRRRRMFDDAARLRAENAEEDARWREKRRAEELAREAEQAERKAETKRRYDAEFIDLTLPVAEPYPDALEVDAGSPWGGGRTFKNYSAMADASIDMIYWHWDARGTFTARFGKETVKGEYGCRGGYTMTPGGEWARGANAKDFFTKEQAEVVLRLLGGKGGPDQITIERIKR